MTDADPEASRDARGLRLPNEEPRRGSEFNPTREETAMTTEMTETTELATTEPDTTPTEPEGTETGSAAEKRYRLQLREAEAERDSLRTVVESMRRQDAERLADGYLVSTKLLWTLGQSPADVLTEDGHGVDPAKVSALCDAVVAHYGNGVRPTRIPGRAYAPLEGRAMRGRPQAESKGMETAFSPAGWDD